MPFRVRVRVGLWLGFSLLAFGAVQAARADLPAGTDELVGALRQDHAVPGIALAYIEDGKVAYKKAYGFAKLESQTLLGENTVMYGASLTKFVFAAYVMDLVAEGKIELDTPIGDLLPKPLPEYEDYSDLDGDERWRKLTLRHLLSHTTGFPNYRFFPPEGGFDKDGKLRFYFEPGARYGYSGEGYYIAQLVVEEVLGLDTATELERRFFTPLGMERTSLTWQDHFKDNYAHGYTREGENKRHNMQSNVRAAGSMDTTLRDFSAFVAAFMGGKLVGAGAQKAMLAPGLAISSRHQFPTLDAAVHDANTDVGLAAAVGAVTWVGPQGRGFFKGGHNEKTDNILVCLEVGRRCVLLLSNTAKGDLIFPEIVDHVLGETGMPWGWEYTALGRE
ncbi:serine hydrolase domain-containing protein [Kordiimonas sp.]|uniref:serine hydrolase domain-containing protein n=1 Tax=Kordiimonas sp. TaxID=1970157 RepID=UPI003A92AE4D